MEDGSSMEADVILYATGRKPRTEDLGLDKAGIKTDKDGAIVVSTMISLCFTHTEYITLRGALQSVCVPAFL